MVIGIDASRNRSGGAKAHIIGILNESEPFENGISEIHIWSYPELLKKIHDHPMLIKHTPVELTKNLFNQLWWQYFKLPKEARKHCCNILLNTDAGSICTFHPSITMSRDMLSFEVGEIKRFKFGFSKLRLIVLRFVQLYSLKKAEGTIFLTKYASDIIQKYSGKIDNFRIIPHGVSEKFKQKTKGGNWDLDAQTTIRGLYVSNISLYKHQWYIVEAVSILRKKGYNISIQFIGPIDPLAEDLFFNSINEFDPNKRFVKYINAVTHDEIPAYLKLADIFIFASSCENMPNTLIEAMASGLPIACSNRGPMPEVLLDGGEYFDPEDLDSIIKAIERILVDKPRRIKLAKQAKVYAEKYSWRTCGIETWEFLKYTYHNKYNTKD